MKKIILLTLLSLPLVSHSQTSLQEKLFVEEVNSVRTNPRAYISQVREYLKVALPQEKEIAEKELIPLLETLPPLRALKISDTLRFQLEKHIVDSTTRWVHHDYAFTWLNSRTKFISENLVLSCKNNQRNSVVQLLIDLSSKDRAHRIYMLDPEATHTAVRKVVFGDESKPLSCRIWWIQVFAKF